jgi:AP-4 complex subunit beta-1
MIRGLALRSLAGLRLTSILEYVLQPLKAALGDSSGYVRQAGVVGVLKVYSISPESITENDFVDTLYNMLRDRDAQVVVNCISALNEMLAAEGGMSVNQAIVVYLLNRIREFSDWGQCVVMDVVARYSPASEDEMFAIMNLLDSCLKVANSAVVLAATKCFMAFTADLPDIQRQVYLRLKTPLLTLMASSTNEVAYAVLSHVALMLDRAPGVFDDEFKQFFCKYSEPGSVKALKMGCLPKVANPGNAREVVAELTEYVSGVDAELARQAVRAIGAIAIRVPPAADVVLEALLELVEMEAEYVRSTTVVALQGELGGLGSSGGAQGCAEVRASHVCSRSRSPGPPSPPLSSYPSRPTAADLLRKYPDRAPSVIPSLHRTLKRLDSSPGGKAAVVWMLGEFGHLIDDAPYILEPLIDLVVSGGGAEGEQLPVGVRCELLTATVKLFFKRPPGACAGGLAGAAG